MSKTITSSVAFQDPKGNVVANGKLILDLSQAAEITSGGGQVVPKRVVITLDANGLIPALTTILANDELTPSGTTYHVLLNDSNGSRLADFGNWSITGSSPIDVSSIVPTTTGASYPAPVLLNPSGNQVIATGNLTLTTGQFIETAHASTGSDGLVRKTSAALVTPSLGVATATSVNKVAITAPATGATITLADGTTVTGPASTDTLVGKATTDTLTNKTLNGASSGNAVTLLNAQGPLTALTGNSSDQTVYTYTIPAGTIGAGKGIRVMVVFLHTTGTAAITYKLTLGTTALESPSITENSSVVNDVWKYTIMNNAAVQNAQSWSRESIFANTGSITLGANAGTSAENTANSLVLKWTFNVANTDQITPKQWLVELIQ